MNIRAVRFEADGEQTVSITKVGSAPAITMQYSYDGKTWDAWDLSALPFGGSTKVYVRGVGNATFGKDSSNYNKITFSTDAFVYVSGVAESLLDGENEVLTYNYGGILRNLFYNQTALRSAKGLRFEATSIYKNEKAVYSYMFYGCTNLLFGPKSLYLVTMPSYACSYMFYGCKSLVNAPELPSKYVGTYCYQRMFYGCTSLVNAPELPAETLTEYYCYEVMFAYCIALKTIRCRAKSGISSATNYWLEKASSSGTLYGHSEYGWASGTSGIPSSWTFVELND